MYFTPTVFPLSLKKSKSTASVAVLFAMAIVVETCP